MATGYRGIAMMADGNGVGCHDTAVITHGDTMAAHEDAMAIPCTPHGIVSAIPRGAHGVGVHCDGIAMMSPLTAMALTCPGYVMTANGDTMAIPCNCKDVAMNSRGNTVRMLSHCRGMLWHCHGLSWQRHDMSEHGRDNGVADDGIAMLTHDDTMAPPSYQRHCDPAYARSWPAIAIIMSVCVSWHAIK